MSLPPQFKVQNNNRPKSILLMAKIIYIYIYIIFIIYVGRDGSGMRIFRPAFFKRDGIGPGRDIKLILIEYTMLFQYRIIIYYVIAISHRNL